MYLDGVGTKVVKFTGVATLRVLLRISNDFILAEASHSLHDAQCVVRCFVKQRALMAGGGAAEIHAAMHPGEACQVRTRGREAGILLSGIRAFVGIHTLHPWRECGPATAANLDKLHSRNAAKHDEPNGTNKSFLYAGIHVKKGYVHADMFYLNIIQLFLVPTSEITLATETVAMIMKVDLIVVQ